MKVTRIQHVSVNVEGGLVDAVAFYRDVLGLDDDHRPEIPGIGGHWFAVGDAQLHLVDASAGSGHVRPGDHHWCVFVDDLDAAVAELDAHGIEHLEGAQGAVRQVWCSDPSGNVLELQQDRPS